MRLSWARGLGNDGGIPLICPTRQMAFVKYETIGRRHRLLCMGLFSSFLLAGPETSGRTSKGGPERSASAIHLQRGDKSFLRDVDLAELPHLLLAFLLLLQKFAFARDVAAVALCGDVLAQGAD